MSYMRDADGNRLDELHAKKRLDVSEPAIAAFEKIRSSQTTVIGVAGDSTGDADTEWVNLLAQKLAIKYTKVAVDYRLWDDTAQAYGTTKILSSLRAQTTGISDTFTRVAADVVGSTPNTGSAWGSSGAAAGDWSLDGADCVRSSDTSTGVVTGVNGAAGADTRIKVTLNIPTTAPASTQFFNLYVKYVDGSNFLRAYIRIDTSGNPSVQMHKVIGGTTTQVGATLFPTALATNVATNETTFELRIDGGTMVAILGSEMTSGTITSSDLSALSTANKVGFGAGPTGTKLHDLTAWALGSVPAGTPTLSIYNGSMSGSTLAYQQSRLAAMYPVALDLLIISSCHNYGSGSASAYRTALDSFISDFTAHDATAAYALTVQNPQYNTANVAAHDARCATLPGYARENGHGLLPAYDYFVARSDGGASLVGGDGVHPLQAGDEIWASMVAAKIAEGGARGVALAAHTSTSTAAHAASAISYAGSSTLSAVDVEGALDELDTEKAATTDTVMKTLVDAKGDIITATADNTPARMAVGSDGAELVADSTQTNGLRWTTSRVLEGAGDPEASVSAPVGSVYRDTTNGWMYEKQTGTGNTGWIAVGQPFPRFSFASGTYVTPHPNPSTSASLVNNTLRVTPWFCPQTLNITRIGAEITVVGESGSKLRLGIYADDGTGHPGTLIVDAGQIAGDSATAQEITLGSTLVLTRGWYWLGGVVQSAPTTQPTVRIVNAATVAPGFLISFGTSLISNPIPDGYSQASVSGTLPSTGASITTTNSSLFPRLFFKLA